MKLPIFEIEFDEEVFESGIDAIALTETPAIDLLSLRFSAEDLITEFQFESYNDYPQAASDNAARALRIRDEVGSDCGTAVGWSRANQLAKRENISRETISRMSAFQRQEGNKSGDPKTDCGALMWLAWGGDEGVAWASKKLKQIDATRLSAQTDKMQFSVNEDKMIIAGPAIIPDKQIYREDDKGNPFYVVFRKEVIEKMVSKFNREYRDVKLNLEHNSELPIEGYIKGNWIIENSQLDKSVVYGFTELPIGTWFIEVQITDRSVWNETIKNMQGTGFSIEGLMGLGKLVLSEIHNKNKQEITMKKAKYFVKVMTDRSVFNKTLQKFEIISEAERTDVLIMSDLAKGATVEMLSAEGVVVPAVNGKYELEVADVCYHITVIDGIIAEFVQEVEDAPMMYAVEGATGASGSTDVAAPVEVAVPETSLTIDELAVKFDELIAKYADMEMKMEEIIAMLPAKPEVTAIAAKETRSQTFARMREQIS